MDGSHYPGPVIIDADRTTKRRLKLFVGKCNEWNGKNSKAVSDINIEPVRLDNPVKSIGENSAEFSA